MESPALTTLPVEILEAICLHLDPRSLVAVSMTSRHIKESTMDAAIIWRHLCQTEFKSWAASHNMAAKFAGPLSDVDWRTVFVNRVNLEKEVLRLLKQIVNEQPYRAGLMNSIANFGYDARDVLLRECSCPDHAEDVLARRYYAQAVLQRIQREMSIKVWKDLNDGESVPLERALGAYDMFTMVGEDVNFETITQNLDGIAAGLLQQYPDFRELNTRTKASLLASFLRAQGFQGVPNTSYRALRNSFIGLVLQSQDHESLPLISVAIYCALASRLGLDARPCGFVFHVYTLIYAPKDYNLDGDYKPTSSEELEYMYMDPFRSSDEVPKSVLQNALRQHAIPISQHKSLLSPTTTREMVLRTTRNIMNSVQNIRGNRHLGLYGMEPVESSPDLDHAFYASLWSAMTICSREVDGTNSDLRRRREYLPYMLEQIRAHFPWDFHLLYRYVKPLFSGEREGSLVSAFWERMELKDRMQKPSYPDDGPENVQYKVGQVFRHHKYLYEGFITGWDSHCDADEAWINTMDVDSLPGGRTQSFYFVRSNDKTTRYVAQENIGLIDEHVGPSNTLLKLAGRHFRRWDNDKHMFVGFIGGGNFESDNSS